MNEKNFEELNIKIIISIQQCTPAPNSSQLVFGTKFAQKHLRVEF